MGGVTIGHMQFDEVPTPTTAEILGYVIIFEIGVVASYVLATDAIITNPLVLIYPFVWIDASLLAILKTDRPVGSTRNRLFALLLALGYFGVLGYFGGLFGPGIEQMAPHFNWGPPPGYAPALIYDNGLFNLVLEPFKVVGYLTLAYFVYATVLDAAAGAIPGVLGLFTCISCSWPILGTIATTIFGSGSAVTAFALSQSYGIGTVVFVSALALLYYRPLY